MCHKARLEEDEVVTETWPGFGHVWCEKHGMGQW